MKIQPNRIAIDLLAPENLEWVRDQATRLELSVSAVVRNLVLAAMEDPVSHPPSVPEPVLPPQDAFLAAVRKWYVLELAAEKAGLDWSEVEAWFDDEHFLAAVQRQQWVRLAELEHVLLEIGRTGKGNALAVNGFLSAHHPFYGRAKAEEFLRGWSRLQDDLFKCLAEEFGPQQAPALERALKRFESMKEVRMAART